VVGRHRLEPPCGLQGREHRRDPDSHCLAADRGADHDHSGANHDSSDNDQCGADHDRFDNNYRDTTNCNSPADRLNNGAAGSEWIVAQHASRKDLWQYVVAEWTCHCPHRCHRCSGRQ
jgi:hypothetical protein